jgi:hypothetical protein
MVFIKKIMLVYLLALAVPAVYGAQGQAPTQDESYNLLVAHVLQGLNRILGLNGVTTNAQLRMIVDTLEKAKELLSEDPKNLAAAQELIDKAQDLPGNKTMIAPGVYDDNGHPVEFSMWRMLALVRNGKNPIAMGV